MRLKNADIASRGVIPVMGRVLTTEMPKHTAKVAEEMIKYSSHAMGYRMYFNPNSRVTIFIIPMQALWEFVELIVLLLVFSVFGAMFILPAVYTFFVSDLDKGDALRKAMEKKPSRLLKKFFGGRGEE